MVFGTTVSLLMHRISVLTPSHIFWFSRTRERKIIQGDSGGMVNVSGGDIMGKCQKIG